MVYPSPLLFSFPALLPCSLFIAQSLTLLYHRSRLNVSYIRDGSSSSRMWVSRSWSDLSCGMPLKVSSIHWTSSNAVAEGQSVTTWDSVVESPSSWPLLSSPGLFPGFCLHIPGELTQGFGWFKIQEISGNAEFFWAKTLWCFCACIFNP